MTNKREVVVLVEQHQSPLHINHLYRVNGKLNLFTFLSMQVGGDEIYIECKKFWGKYD